MKHHTNVAFGSNHRMHAIDAPISDQLCPSVDLHNVHVVPLACCD